METSIYIKGLDIDILNYSTLKLKLTEFLDNDHFNIVFLASPSMMREAGKSEEYREILTKADYILPGEEGILGDSIPQKDGLALNYHWIEKLILNWKSDAKTLYLLGTDEEKLKKFVTFFEEQGLDRQVLGGYCINPELGPEVIINEINAVNPDMIITLMESPMQENWIIENSTKMSARLCLGIGSYADRILNSGSSMPALFRILHLGRLYRFFKGMK